MDQDQIRRRPFCGGQTERSDLSVCPHCGAQADEPVGSDLEQPEDRELAAERADWDRWGAAQPEDDERRAEVNDVLLELREVNEALRTLVGSLFRRR